MGFSATPGSKTPEPIAMKFRVRNYVQDPTPASKYGSDRAFFTSPTGRHTGPIFTIYTSNDAFSRKEVPFEGLNDEF